MSLPLHSFFIAAALMMVLCLFPSCIRSNIGESIRAGGEVRLGVDVNHPVDSLRHCIPATGEIPERVYVLASEVSYRVEPPLIVAKPSPLASLLELTPPHRAIPALDLSPTGRVLVVECEYWNHELRPMAILKELPPETQPCGMHSDQNHAPSDTHRLGCFGYREEAGMGRKLAAAPFDYALDPIITVGATIVSCVYGAGFMLFYWLPNLIFSGDAHPPM